MKELFNKLAEYLGDDNYSPQAIKRDIGEARIRVVKKDYVEVVWKTGILERLMLIEGKLVSKKPYPIIEHAIWEDKNRKKAK